jgi:hypothetical protein
MSDSAPDLLLLETASTVQITMEPTGMLILLLLCEASLADYHPSFFKQKYSELNLVFPVATFSSGPSSSEGDRRGNCHPGLVVENEVPGFMKNDFYLQSHGAIKAVSTLLIICLADLLMDCSI